MRRRGAFDRPGDRPAPDERGAGRLDPTKMVNQPALRTSSGLSWIIVGGLFAAVSLVPLGLLVFAASGRSRGVATAVAIVIVVLYALMLAVRFAAREGPKRLRMMAACMLAMAAVGLIGVWICALLEVAS